MDFQVIEQNDNWLAINKPAGVGMHSEMSQPGLIEQLKQHLALDYLAPVHRLDKVTSGCLLLAKNETAASVLSKQFMNKATEKVYLALTLGQPKKKQGTIKGDMIKTRDGSWKLTRKMNNPSITHFVSLGYKDGLRLAVVKIETGKTHQIRVAMKSNSSPVWGDLRYGDKVTNEKADRCYLHAYQLKFFDLDNKPVVLSCKALQGKDFDWTLIDSQLKRVPDSLLVKLK
jgi:tRNA pseudouridine32 synthase/23S rRNA pseudouridine746 synthase